MELYKKVSEGAKNLGEGLSEGAKTIGKKSSELVNVAKLKIEMGKLEKEMENNMAALGKFVYLQFKDEPVAQEEIDRLLASSAALDEDIYNLAQQIEKLMPKPMVCENCQTKLPSTANFCVNCGNKTSNFEVRE
jgi:ribosomal protein L40E